VQYSAAGGGAERLLWASDKSMMPYYRWCDLLNYLRYDPELSRDEKEWILGRSAQRILNWQTASA
jgi:predicted TIM-barrel fold metal-dependent hydrolase